MNTVKSCALSLTLCIFVTLVADVEYETMLIDHVKSCIENAQKGISKLDNRVLSIEGMSSAKVRHLLNNICSLPNASYLEIGVWKGSTLVSALFGNTVAHAIALDNWSQFGGPKKEFMHNVSSLLTAGSVQLYDSDCFTIDQQAVFRLPINIYFYDGDHNQASQYKAFTYFNTIFADVFIAMVDDWDWESVHTGTRNAFRDLGYQILFEEELPSYCVNDKDNWWNGLYIGVIKKINV